MPSHRFIQIQPQFELGDFSLKLSPEIDIDELEKYGYDEGDLSYAQFFSPFLKKEANQYSLQFSETIDLSSLESTLKDLSPLIENTHFFIYFETARFTFETLEIIEVKIRTGQLTYKTHFIKDLIPNSLFLDLKAGGVQQEFNFPIELLMAQADNWNKKMTDFLISELIGLISINIKQMQEDGGLFYGTAFNLEYDLDCLRKLKTNIPLEISKSIRNIQNTHREIVLYNLEKKIEPPLNKRVLLADFQQLEKELGVTFPLTFKLIYTEIIEGGFGPGFGFLKLREAKYSIKNLTILFRKQLNTPEYLVPFVYLKNEIYCCFDTRKSSFPVINFYRSKAVENSKWYDAYIQQTYSFEEWLINWIEAIFPEIYQIDNKLK